MVKKNIIVVVVAVMLSLVGVLSASAEDVTLPKIVEQKYASVLENATNIVDPSVLRETAVKFEQATLLVLQVGEIYLQQLKYSDVSTAGMYKVTKNIKKVTALQSKIDKEAATNIRESRTPLDRVIKEEYDETYWWEFYWLTVKDKILFQLINYISPW